MLSVVFSGSGDSYLEHEYFIQLLEALLAGRQAVFLAELSIEFIEWAVLVSLKSINAILDSEAVSISL